MAERRPLTRIGGTTKELPAGDTLPGSLPTGGTAGQVVTKTGSADYAAGWSDPLTAAQAKAIARRQALRYSTR